jgi:hypothetical protein
MLGQPSPPFVFAVPRVPWILSDGTAIAIRKGLAADRRIISAFLDAM